MKTRLKATCYRCNDVLFDGYVDSLPNGALPMPSDVADHIRFQHPHDIQPPRIGLAYSTEDSYPGEMRELARRVEPYLTNSQRAGWMPKMEYKNTSS